MPLSFTSIDWIFDWVQQPTWKLVALIFVNILWIPFFLWFLKEFWESWGFWVVGMHREVNRRPIFLAVDAPREAEQTPASMEAIFNQLAGAHGQESWWEKHWDGDHQDWFSFEIVSIDGYIQYIIMCNDYRRDLVEAAIYAQYPDAEITEVNDYTDGVPDTWPQEDWKMMATEYQLDRENAYPIKTYVEFEDKIRGELIDPMASMLEIMSKLKKGEQLWFQLIAIPVIEPEWVPEAQKIIDKFVEKVAPPAKKGIIDYLIAIPTGIVNIVDQGLNPEKIDNPPKEERKDTGPRTNVLGLTPGEKTLVELMENKLGKIAYKCRIRIMYIAKNEVFNKAGSYSGMVGAIKQFNDGSRNWFSVTKKSWTKTNYSFKKARLYQRMQNFYDAYKKRTTYGGAVPGRFILNVEEMATLYHFPMLTVKAPTVKRTGAKKSEPPPTLPVEDEDSSETVSIPTVDVVAPTVGKAGVPEPPSDEPDQPAEPAKEPEATDSAMPSGVTFVDIPNLEDKPVSEPEPAAPQPAAKKVGGPPPDLPIA